MNVFLFSWISFPIWISGFFFLFIRHLWRKKRTWKENHHENLFSHTETHINVLFQSRLDFFSNIKHNKGEKKHAKNKIRKRIGFFSCSESTINIWSMIMAWIVTLSHIFWLHSKVTRYSHMKICLNLKIDSFYRRRKNNDEISALWILSVGFCCVLLFYFE